MSHSSSWTAEVPSRDGFYWMLPLRPGLATSDVPGAVFPLMDVDPVVVFWQPDGSEVKEVRALFWPEPLSPPPHEGVIRGFYESVEGA